MMKKVDPKVMCNLAAQGCPLSEIAAAMGMTRQTLYARFKKNPKLREMLDDARKKAITAVRSALYDKAIAGDVRAIDLYLTNYKAEGWGSHRKHQHEHKHNREAHEFSDAELVAFIGSSGATAKEKGASKPH